MKQSRERVNRFIFASSVYTLFYTLSYLFSLWWNEQTTAAAAGSRHNIFNNDTISSFYTSFASHIANKTATAWNTTTTKKKKVLVQENMRFRAQRWEDIGLDSCSNIFPGPPLFSSSSSSRADWRLSAVVVYAQSPLLKAEAPVPSPSRYFLQCVAVVVRRRRVLLLSFSRR